MCEISSSKLNDVIVIVDFEQVQFSQDGRGCIQSSRFPINHVSATAIIRSNHQSCSIKDDVLKTFAIFTGKHLYWILFFKNPADKACKFIKKRLQHSCFPENIYERQLLFYSLLLLKMLYSKPIVTTIHKCTDSVYYICKNFDICVYLRLFILL